MFSGSVAATSGKTQSAGLSSNCFRPQESCRAPFCVQCGYTAECAGSSANGTAASAVLRAGASQQRFGCKNAKCSSVTSYEDLERQELDPSTA